jgi:hypothetical protein
MRFRFTTPTGPVTRFRRGHTAARTLPNACSRAAPPVCCAPGAMVTGGSGEPFGRDAAAVARAFVAPVRAERPYRRCPVSRAFGSPDLASKDVGTRCLCQVQLWLRVRLPMRLQRHSPGDPAECCRANEHGLGPFERCACSPVRWRDQPVPPPSVSAVRAFRSAPFAAAVIDRTRRLPVGGAGKAMVGCRTSKTPRSARSSPTIRP